MQANLEIRNAAKKAKVKLWEIADTIGITDGTFSRKLRKELDEKERNKILNIIEELAKEKEAAANENANH